MASNFNLGYISFDDIAKGQFRESLSNPSSLTNIYESLLNRAQAASLAGNNEAAAEYMNKAMELSALNGDTSMPVDAATSLDTATEELRSQLSEGGLGLRDEEVGSYDEVKMPNDYLFDQRVLKTVIVGTTPINIVPGWSIGSHFGDYFETPQAALQAADERHSDNPLEENAIAEIGKRRAVALQNMWNNEMKNYKSGHSFIHPYALFTLAGTTLSSNDGTYYFDNAKFRKYYEIDGDNRGGYAKNPTTTAIINWGAQDGRGRFPYSFTDFVYCKYWNKIQNNRMITLRRYPMPIPDSVEPANYDFDDKIAHNSSEPFSPMATAVTYFGEGTGNSLKDILKFTVGYNWKELEGDVWKTTSQQNESGQGLMGTAAGFFGTGLSQIIQGLGILDDFKGKNRIQATDAVGLGPDPYSNGPYENRIIGPINVINKVMKRERGLTFTGDGLNITFEYVARPIAGVNNKAIMIDLLSNMLVMTSSSGTFFGGMHRYRTEKPAVYPMRDTYSLTQLYKGKIFGKDGAPASLLKTAFSHSNTSFMLNFAKDLLADIGAVAKDFVGIMTGQGSSAEGRQARADLKRTGEQVAGTAGRVVAAHMLKGASIPWLEGARAILTGEAVGDWHLTIGNPLNPIAMIGNLIVDNCEYEFSEELGPDDFPVSFKATVHLKHGMGRDRDGVMSMFNRGYGRTYSLPDSFISSADRGTKVDNYTNYKDNGKNQVDMWQRIQTTGRDAITAKGIYPLTNAGFAYNNELKNYKLDLKDIGRDKKYYSWGTYFALPWQMRWTL